ncbi:N-hydroxyarylamine O-acetyltransferase [Pseudorhizobium tarimense]|uniref:N-hydroxyarylamine O-acetyltransferase n=1 Tax=Pseudorhizobium tarimense TaxID=1079109 RepID=A0ABV2H6T7_9HYPH|nr:arylamine N-acetyltransferase [Pseudorhizobium tarimense]MCJ8519428.1 arylamine N-acetyltransferase [Pseudorhizobium tarimense]
MFDIDQYTQRIGLSSCETTEAGLFALQRAQLATIAFEDIDAYLGRVPSLEPERIWSKLVTGGRGGYCFELNWLFGEALKHLGFAVRPILGRVRMGAPVGGIRAHLAWIVTIDGQDWLADAGFGGPGPRDPVRLQQGVLTSGGTEFRLRQDEESGEWVLEWRNPDGWFALFGFNELPFTKADIEGANQLCATWGMLPFRNNLMMSIRLPSEDVALLGRNLRRVGDQGPVDTQIASADELDGHLRGLFGLRLDDTTVAQIWRRLNETESLLAAA